MFFYFLDTIYISKAFGFILDHWVILYPLICGVNPFSSCLLWCKSKALSSYFLGIIYISKAFEFILDYRVILYFLICGVNPFMSCSYWCKTRFYFLFSWHYLHFKGFQIHSGLLGHSVSFNMWSEPFYLVLVMMYNKVLLTISEVLFTFQRVSDSHLVILYPLICGVSPFISCSLWCRTRFCFESMFINNTPPTNHTSFTTLPYWLYIDTSQLSYADGTQIMAAHCQLLLITTKHFSY